MDNKKWIVRVVLVSIMVYNYYMMADMYDSVYSERLILVESAVQATQIGIESIIVSLGHLGAILLSVSIFLAHEITLLISGINRQKGSSYGRDNQGDKKAFSNTEIQS